MKKIFCLFICVIILLSACGKKEAPDKDGSAEGNNGGTIGGSEPTGKPESETDMPPNIELARPDVLNPDNGERKLVLVNYYLGTGDRTREHTMLTRLINSFTELYPHVSINELNFYHPTLYTEYIDNLFYDPDSDEALNPPDIIMLADLMKIFDKKIENRFTDIYELMYADLDFVLTDYFYNIFEALSVNNKLPVYPRFFKNNVMTINDSAPEYLKQLHSEEQSVNAFNMLALWEQTPDFYFYEGFLPKDMAMDLFCGFFDMKKSICDFENDLFINAMERSFKAANPLLFDKAYLLQQASQLELMQRNFLTKKALEKNSETYLFNRTAINYVQFLLPTEKYDGFFFHEPKFLNDLSGQILLEDVEGWCIMEESAEKELAWEFLKYITAAVSYPYYIDLVPGEYIMLDEPPSHDRLSVKKSVAYNQLLVMTAEIAKNSYSLDRFNAIPDVRELLDELEDIISQLADAPININFLQNTINPVINEKLDEIFDNFYLGEINASHVALQLQELLEPFLP
ncbi:MAG: hypothetical protein FWE82_03980 [Defluviitaleaceae bacterium]|nr:hypothetical protein [Defluviitaleaceae bacterium]